MHWRFKIFAKIVLSRLPMSYDFWQKLGLFRHGGMDDGDYTISVVTSHTQRAAGSAGISGSSCLELGPGDSLGSALVAKAMGASRIFLVDATDAALKDPSYYRVLAEQLKDRGLELDDRLISTDVNLTMANLDCSYLTEGLQSLKSIPDDTVDYLWSHAVLEHIRRHELLETFQQMRRILTPSGVMSHVIDFRDHLGGELNNLRFSEKIWESDFMSKSGFYTNRVSVSEMLELMSEAGFDVELIHTGKWSDAPIARHQVTRKLRKKSDDDLKTYEASVIARPRSIQLGGR